ncbi:hypothetical protein QA596_08050 [Balneolales bacterium ANBcel1]|nr:hypothetical protein [Balneolales bacterium ANBcel1]
MDHTAVDLLILLLIFVASSLGSRWMMYRMGYGLPARLTGREAAILVAMKILLMTIWAIVLIVLLWLIGVNPLKL